MIRKEQTEYRLHLRELARKLGIKEEIISVSIVDSVIIITCPERAYTGL